MPDNPKTLDPVAPPETHRENRNPSGFNEPDYPDNAADQIIPEVGETRKEDDASGFDDRSPSDKRSDVNSSRGNIHKY